MTEAPKIPDESPSTPAQLRVAPGYLARRLYQAYLAAWVRRVDATVTGPQLAVLMAAHDYPGVDQGSLGSSVALDRSTMADIVRRLEARDLIVRRTAPHDGRRKLLYLTELGAATFEEINRRARELDELLLEDYPARPRGRFLDELTALAELWESVAEG